MTAARRRGRHRQQVQISLLVPFRAEHSAVHRTRIWDWLQEYWRHELPAAEIVVGRSDGATFSKTAAVNDAAARAHGRVFVILDSDCYIGGAVIEHCADAIEKAQARGQRRWFIPYRRLYRLTEQCTERVLGSDPLDPPRFPTPPLRVDVASTIGSMHGRRFGAMIQIMGREAFEDVGGMDLRFRGWGAEDIAFVRALDTIHGHHKTSDNDVLHLWHPTLGVNHKDRLWEGQHSARANEHLGQRYNMATGDRQRMRRLVAEGLHAPGPPPD